MSDIIVKEAKPAVDEEIENDDDITTNDVEGETNIVVDIDDSEYDIVTPNVIKVGTIENNIDGYLDSKRELIAEKIGLAVDKIDSDVGGAIMVYLMSGTMLRSGLALLCYDASGGEENDADDIAAIIAVSYTHLRAHET